MNRKTRKYWERHPRAKPSEDITIPFSREPCTIEQAFHQARQRGLMALVFLTASRLCHQTIDPKSGKETNAILNGTAGPAKNAAVITAFKTIGYDIATKTEEAEPKITEKITLAPQIAAQPILVEKLTDADLDILAETGASEKWNRRHNPRSRHTNLGRVVQFFQSDVPPDHAPAFTA